MFADSLGWLRIVLDYPPSVAWRRKVLPWFSVRDLSACPRGAAVPPGSSVLRCSWSSRWGHLSQVGTGFFLSQRSCRRLSLLLVGLVPGLCAGSPASGWSCVFRHALVLEAGPPSHRLVLLLRTGFLFSGPGWCGRLQLFPSPMYSFGIWSPFGSIVSFCHLIVNEGFHWLLLFRCSHPFWGRVVVFIRPP